MFVYCHQIAERTFCFDDVGCLPLCARCSGFVLGLVLGWVITRARGLWIHVRYTILGVLLAMGLNGLTLVFVQLDTNVVRLFLGGLWGAAFTVGARYRIPFTLTKQ